MAISMTMVKQRRPKKKLAILSASRSTDTEVNVHNETDPLNKEPFLATGDRFLLVGDLDRIAFDFQLTDLLLQCPNNNIIV